MRVTSATMHRTVNEGLQGSLGRLQRVQGQLSSGRRINRYSDAPADATAALRLRAEASDWTSFGRQADDGVAMLNTQDQALQSASALLQRARELALAAANATVDGAGRQAIAAEIDGIRDQLVGVANTTYQGRSVFGGFGDEAVAAGPGGTWSYAGDDGAVRRRVTPDLTVQVNGDGRAIFGFGAGETDVLTTLDRLAAAVRAGETAQVGSTHLGALDDRIRGVLTGLSVVGARTRLVEDARETGAMQLGTIAEHRSSLEDVDLAAQVLEMQLAETAYQAALAAAGRVNLPTLADFLR
jgi:flagellar hook-associated protein 3 FlgL